MTKLFDQYFFPGLDAEFCQTLGDIRCDMIAESLEQMTVYKAVRSIGEGLFWCKENGEAGSTTDSGCGRDCTDYKPRNGKNGRCLHSGFCYEHGQAFILHKDGKLVKA